MAYYCRVQIVKGNKKENVTAGSLNDLVKGYKKIIIDLGTGDGRYVYKKALENPTSFLIGIDPSAKQLETFSKKANRKRLENVLFCVGSIENVPHELKGVADELVIILPWGSLLQEIVVPKVETIEKVVELLQPNGEIIIILGYSLDSEPSETERLNLPEIDKKYIEKNMLPVFEQAQLKLHSLQETQKNELKKIGTTWGNKLSFGTDRKIFRLELIKN